MKQAIKIGSPLLLFALIVFGCSKSGKQADESLVRSKDAENVKRTMENVFFSGEIKTAEQVTQFSDKNGIARMLLPLAGNESSKCFRYVLMEQKAGDKGKKVYLVSREPLSVADDLFAIDFGQEAIVYYEKGATKTTHKKSKIRVKLKDQEGGYDLGTPSVNLLPACGSGVGPGQPVCIDWYWTWYNADTGEILMETYLYTSCEEPCGGGGSGGGQAPCVDVCEAEMAKAINGMSAVSEEPGPVQTQNIDGIRKYKNPRWKILQNSFGNWSLWSHEEGIVQLVDVEKNKWVWISLVHKGITMKGSPAPGVSVSYTQGIGTPSFVAGTPNVLYAGMEVEFQTSVAFVCQSCPLNALIPPVVNNWKSSRIWAAKP